MREMEEGWKKQNGKLKMSTAKEMLREKKKEWSKYWDQHMPRAHQCQGRYIQLGPLGRGRSWGHPAPLG